MWCRYKDSGTGMHVGHSSGRDVKVDLTVFTVKGEQFLFCWVRQLEVAVEATVENSDVQMSNSSLMATLKNKLSPIHNPVQHITVDIIIWQFSRHCTTLLLSIKGWHQKMCTLVVLLTMTNSCPRKKLDFDVVFMLVVPHVNCPYMCVNTHFSPNVNYLCFTYVSFPHEKRLILHVNFS